MLLFKGKYLAVGGLVDEPELVEWEGRVLRRNRTYGICFLKASYLKCG